MSRLLTQSGPRETPCLGNLNKRQEVCGDGMSAKMAVEGLRNIIRLFPSLHVIKKIFRTESNSSPLCRMRRVISREKKEKKFKAQADQSETERADTV